MAPQDKAAQYDETAKEIAAVLEGEPNITARMATVACLLSQAFVTYYWTGFYVVDPEKENELVVGPYQGTLGCMRIEFGKGVCGAAAAARETQIVEDVHAIENHIACDVNTNSEIVVPVFNKAGALIAVFDVDSTKRGSFDTTDKEGLERILKATFGR